MTKARRFPPWLTKRLPPEEQTQPVVDLLTELRLGTVCQEARCPNIGECFRQRTATFRSLGCTCTRDCRFCAVDHGQSQPVDPAEPSALG